MVVLEKACAKINLFLDVIGLREDGFHELRTVMQTVSLEDTVEICIAPAAFAAVHLETTAAELPTDAGNLAYRAAALYLAESGMPSCVDIRIEKRIPIAGGLAGGSADAAAVLRGMNRLLRRFSEHDLLDLAAKLGSDVPFCLLGGVRLCGGRGEQMASFSLPQAGYYVLLNGGERVSTPAAFRALDEKYAPWQAQVAEDRLCAFSKEPYQNIFNIFESVVLPSCPIAQEQRNTIEALGGVAFMSGSGATIVGWFSTKAEAMRAAEASGGIFAEGTPAYVDF